MRMMVSITFDPANREQIAPLIPAEQARVRELREAGSLEALYLGAEGQHGWLVCSGADEAAIRRDMASLPMHPFMQATYVPLRD